MAQRLARQRRLSCLPLGDQDLGDLGLPLQRSSSDSWIQELVDGRLESHGGTWKSRDLSTGTPLLAVAANG